MEFHLQELFVCRHKPIDQLIHLSFNSVIKLENVHFMVLHVIDIEPHSHAFYVICNDVQCFMGFFFDIKNKMKNILYVLCLKIDFSINVNYIFIVNVCGHNIYMYLCDN